MNHHPLPKAVRTLLAGLLLVALFAALIGQAQTVSPYLAFQGYLTDGNGVPLGSTNTGLITPNLIIRLWTAPTGGTEVYAEQQIVTANNGYFAALIGQGSAYQSEVHPQLASVFASNVSLYVELTLPGYGNAVIGGQNLTLSPRTPLLTVPNAFFAQNAANVGTATYALNMGTASTNAQVVNPTGNTVNFTEGVGVNAAVTATNAVVTGTNGQIIVNGTAVCPQLNVTNQLAAGTLLLTNSLMSASLSVPGNVSTAAAGVGGTAHAGKLTVTNTLSTPALSVLSVMTPLVAAGTASVQLVTAPSLTAQSVNLTNALSAPVVNVPGAAVAMNTATNTLYVTAGDYGLRIVRGTVTSAGVIANNGGTCTCTKGSSSYTITFARAFSSTPMVAVTPVSTTYPINNDAVTYFTPVVLSVSTTSATFEFVNWDGDNNPNPQAFHFIALGQP